MGPQHPMTHGLWNMKVKVDGETITDAKPEIGYLHRGYEKIMEVREFQISTEGVGTLSAADAINWGVTGPNLRACGVNVDLRRLDPYETYEEIDFEPQVWHDGGVGDSYARFVVRYNELRESCNIIRQALEKMPKTGPYRVKPPRRAEGEGYAKTEDSRGEALFYVIGDGDDRPYRVKIRSPVFCTMAATPILLRGNKLADVVSILGSVDVCVGEMDK